MLRRKPHTPFDRVPGFTCFHFLVGYGILRAITDHWRPERVNFGPITGGQALSLALAVIGLIGAQVRYRMIRKYGAELDYYPEDGVDGALPDEVHAHIDAINAERRAREAAKAAETAAK